MKKYNYLILFSIVFYFCIAVFLGHSLISMEEKRDQVYRVEINRIIENLMNIDSIERIDFSHYSSIEKVEFLDFLVTDKNSIHSFYSEANNEKIRIIPYYEDDQLIGYLKFVYSLPELSIKQIFWLSQVSLMLLELFVLCLLFYLKRKLIDPFQRLNNIALDIAKGHLKGEIKEEKNRYLGRFMWAIGQLKDKLDITHQKELEMMKDKKTILLSLSHDIKTPINLIKLYSKALEKDIYTKKEDQLHAMYQINREAEEIENYVDEIIRSSREDVLDIQAEEGEFYLKDLIQNTLAVYKEQCQLRQIELTVETFENRLLKGDIERSQEILENLFENAFKYGDGRRINISFYEEDYCQLIRFFNTGEAIADNEFNHLFDSFFRGTNSHGSRGNGLGLYICHELMRKMDGDIFAEKTDEGMAFILVFR